METNLYGAETDRQSTRAGYQAYRAYHPRYAFYHARVLSPFTMSFDARTLRVPVRRSGFFASLRLSHELLLIEMPPCASACNRLLCRVYGQEYQALCRLPCSLSADQDASFTGSFTPKENNGCFREGPLQKWALPILFPPLPYFFPFGFMGAFD